jgi:hypothetical protein
VTVKPSGNEDEFFLREEAEKLHRLHTEKLRTSDAAKDAADKALHWMKCSKCGYGLETIRWRSVEIEKCFRCGVVVLDDGELEKLAGSEGDSTFFASFKTLFSK